VPRVLLERQRKIAQMPERKLLGVDESRLVVFDLNVLYRIVKEKIMNIW
jgi:hypothetical protein